jgi:acetyl/propionyl-CoA carboxylase alpha subunit
MQIGVANRLPLPFAQDDITFTGHAIEVRLVAEDPAAGWLPSTGTVTEFEIAGDVRVDTGFRAGSTVSSDYDSLLAKVIAHHADRGVAALRIGRAMRTARIGGVRTNADTLAAIMDEPDFRAGLTPTAYLDEHPSVLTDPGPVGDDRLALLCGAVFADEHRNRASDRITGFAPSGWRNLRTRGQRRIWLLGDEPHHVEYELTGSTAVVKVGPWPEPTADGSLPADERRVAAVRLLHRAPSRQVVELDGRRHVIDVEVGEDHVRTAAPAGSLTWTRPRRWVDHDADEAGSGPVSPLPGTVIAVHVEAGQSVVDGQLLMVVEAMKMEHKITAHGDHVVTAVHFGVGDRVDTGDLLVALSSPDQE